jgi:hypothetical protein
MNTRMLLAVGIIAANVSIEVARVANRREPAHEESFHVVGGDALGERH